MATVLRWEGTFLVAALGFGLVSALSTRWFLGFVAMSGLFIYLAWMRAFGDSESSRIFRRRARSLGLWVWGALLLLIGLAIFWRFSRWWGATIFGVVYLAVAAWHLRWLARRDGQPALLFRQTVALSLLPILFAWLVNSTAYQIYTIVGSQAQFSDVDERGWGERRDLRRAELAASDTSVAVALSGGGYRAAAIHAGILSVLEEAELPVSLLSTVSGGSIVGGAYSMGMSAADFRDHLARDKPGLPNDLINFYPVMAQLFVPGYGSGDTYANHFDRAHFAGHTLDDTGPPTLIINATRYREGTRRAFWSENDGDLALGRLVAASGAFPVAFDPVEIEGEAFIDGGVVENLGIAGLQQYFAAHGNDADLAERLPEVLIISDAGLIPEAPPSWTKPSVPQMAMRAQQISYFAMHRWIYSFYTDGAYDRAGEGAGEQPFEVPAGRLWPGLPSNLARRTVSLFIFSPSSPFERNRYEGNEAVLDAVSGLDTLSELEADEVAAAFWVGARLAESYLPALCDAARIECRPVTISRTLPAPAR
jgi:predicted acylesterase/phospholipase RssA